MIRQFNPFYLFYFLLFLFITYNIKMEAFEQIPIEIDKKKGRRSLSLSIDHLGCIILKLPIRISQKEVEDFLKKHKKWILSEYQKRQKEIKNYPSFKIQEGEEFLFLGEKRVLKIIKNKRSLKIEITGKDFCLMIPEKYWNQEKKLNHEKQVKEFIHDFYKGYAQKILKEKTIFWSQKMRLFPRKVKFKKMKTLWGSCSEKKDISLNQKLIMAKEPAIDYVIIHELAHLKHFDHSKDFWNLVSIYCPDYLKQRNYLKNNENLFLLFDF